MHHDLKTEQQKITEQETKGVESTESKRRNKSLDPDSAAAAMEAFAQIRKKTGKAQEQNLFKRPLVVDQEKATITINLNNTLQQAILDEIKLDLVGFLRDRLENDYVSIAVDFQKSGEENKLYTNREKFDHLKKKNPFIKDLEEKLGLDPEF